MQVLRAFQEMQTTDSKNQRREIERRDGEGRREKRREGQRESEDITVKRSCVETRRYGENYMEEVTSGLNVGEWVGNIRAMYLKTTVTYHLTPIMIATTKKGIK